MVVEKGRERNEKQAKSTAEPGTQGTRGGTSKNKGKDHGESPASSDEDTGVASPEAQARRTRSTLLKASGMYRHWVY